MMPPEGRGFESLRLRQKEVVNISLQLLILFIRGIRTRSDKKQSGGLFLRRGNERMRGDRHGSAETKSLRLRQKGSSNFYLRLPFNLWFCFEI